MAACDFDPDKASFCSALGLIFYLEDEIVDDIFRFVLSLPPPSEIVFSFIPTDADLDGLDLEFARWLAAKVARIGEPWKIRVRPEDIVKRISDLGFREVFYLSPELVHARYLYGRSDKLATPHFEQMIAAAV